MTEELRPRETGWPRLRARAGYEAKRLRELAGRAVARARTLDGALVAVVLGIALLTSLSSFGAYVNGALFFEPVMKLRAALGLQPELDPSVRIVLLEDHSLKNLGRHPTFGEWQGIANLLFEKGFEKVFLIGVHNLESEVGRLEPKARRGELVVGAVVVDDENKFSRPLTEIDDELFARDHGQRGGEVFDVATHALLPDARVLDRADHLGNLNILSNYTMPAAYGAGGGRLLPNMGLLAVDGLHWRGGHPENANGRIPLSEDGTLYVDFVPIGSALAAAVPVGAFFKLPQAGEEGEPELKSDLSPKLEARLAGGRIAVLVPEAYTGSRFIDSPQGKVPSYLAIVSLVNGALHHDFLYRPVRHAWLVALFAVGILLLLRSREPRVALGASAAAIAGLVAASVALLMTVGWHLPCAHVALVGLGGWAVRWTSHLLQVLQEKLALSKDLEMGQTIQRLLFPKAGTGRVGCYEYKIVYRPYGAMAGDWYQLFDAVTESGRHTAVIAIGDGVGKGPSAALVTAVIAGTWNSHVQYWRKGDIDVERFIQSLHANLSLTFRGEQNTTLSIAVLTESSARLAVFAAPFWLQIKGADRSVKKVRATPSNPLGVLIRGVVEPIKPTLVEVEAQDGDVFVAYSDGVMDGLSAENRFKRTLTRSTVETSSPDFFDEIERIATAAGEDSIQPDDFTLLMIRRVPSAAAPAEPEEAGKPAEDGVKSA